MPPISLALKITNWCNLNCAHCWESSSCNQPVNLMPLDSVNRYLREFKELAQPKSQSLVITGGEVMAPYYHGESSYMLKVIGTAYANGFIPVIKTNGMWGDDSGLRNQILGDLSIAGHAKKKLVKLDISIDEFRDNITPVANIIYDVVFNPRLTDSIRISLQGFNTDQSAKQLSKLITEVAKHDLRITPSFDGDFGVSRGYNGMLIISDFDHVLFRRGRAADNDLTKRSLLYQCGSDSLTIDNCDNAILNHGHSANVKDISLKDVMPKLIKKNRGR